MFMEKVILYHLNDVVREGKLMKISKEMPKIGIDKVLIGVQTGPVHGHAFEIDNPELYNRFYGAWGHAWFQAKFSLLYTLPREKAHKFLAAQIEPKGECYKGECYIFPEMVDESVKSTLISHINKSY